LQEKGWMPCVPFNSDPGYKKAAWRKTTPLEADPAKAESAATFTKYG
jgi:ribulose bisphosphate carboxylase small subunit